MASVTRIVRRRHKRQERQQLQRSQRRLWNSVIGVALLVLVIIPGGAALGSAVITYWQAVQNLPAPGEADANGAAPTQFFDSTGATLVYTLQNPLNTDTQNGGWVSIDTLPPYLIDATLAAEDPGFLDRPGFNPLDTLVKLWRNMLIGTLPPDASITGRLVRNVIAPFADLRGSANDARAHEIALIAEINRRYTPRQVLEWHLNTDYYGNEAYGIEAAAQIYLNKRAVDLTLDEAALLAAIPTAPQYNPFANETAARGRQTDLLRSMMNYGMISQETYTTTAAVNTPISRGNYLPPVAPEFTVYARAQAQDILDSLGYDGSRLLARGSLKITTTLDLDLYQQSVCTLQTQLARLGTASAPGTGNCSAAAYLPPLTDLPAGADVLPDSGSLVIIDAATGAIKSMVGDASAEQYEPGPILQPFVYLSAFTSGGSYTPATMVFDIPNQFPGSEEGLIYTVGNRGRQVSRSDESARSDGGRITPSCCGHRQQAGHEHDLTNGASTGAEQPRREQLRSDAARTRRAGLAARYRLRLLGVCDTRQYARRPDRAGRAWLSRARPGGGLRNSGRRRQYPLEV